MRLPPACTCICWCSTMSPHLHSCVQCELRSARQEVIPEIECEEMIPDTNREVVIPEIDRNISNGKEWVPIAVDDEATACVLEFISCTQ